MNNPRYEKVDLSNKREIMPFFVASYNGRLVRVLDSIDEESWLEGRLMVNKGNSDNLNNYQLRLSNGESLSLRYSDLKALEVNLAVEES